MTDRALLEELTRAAVRDIPRRHASPRLFVTSPDNRRAVVLLGLDRAPQRLLIAALCERDDTGAWYALAESDDGLLIAGTGDGTVAARFGVVSPEGPAGVMAVAGGNIPVTVDQGHFVAVNWNAVGPSPPAPEDLPTSSGAYVRWTEGESA